MSSTTTIAADYTSVKEDIINQSSLYFATMYPALSKAGQWGALLSMATALGDATVKSCILSLLLLLFIYVSVLGSSPCLQTTASC